MRGRQRTGKGCVSTALAIAAVRKRDHRRAWHDVVSALIRCPGLETDDAVSILVDCLVDDATAEPDDVREIDVGPVLRSERLQEADVTHPVGERVNLPARALDADVVGHLGALELGRVVVVVDRVDGLEGVSRRIAEGPAGMAPILFE